jgi:hypothetical protein
MLFVTVIVSCHMRMSPTGVPRARCHAAHLNAAGPAAQASQDVKQFKLTLNKSVHTFNAVPSTLTLEEVQNTSLPVFAS